MCGLVIALYRFSITDILWAGQWYDSAHLRFQPSYGAKEYVHQFSSSYLNFYFGYRFIFNSSRHPDHGLIPKLLFLRFASW